jgi:putative component of membrane protein insertase Oxa1/YidC/SpoIIIJ protein YidD
MLLLVVIRLYWALWPPSARRTCLFRQSCSRHVYRTTRRYGLRVGWLALCQRYRQCRPGALNFQHPILGTWHLLLADGTQLSPYEVAPTSRPQ